MVGPTVNVAVSQRSKLQARKQSLLVSEAATKGARKGLSVRQVTIPLPAILANGVVQFGVWIPEKKSVVTSMRVGYLIVPSSALGTIVLDVKKISAGVTTLLQDAAAFDLEGLAAGVPVQVTSLLLAKTIRTEQQGDYVYAEITSDNADAVAGAGGVLTITYQ